MGQRQEETLSTMTVKEEEETENVSLQQLQDWGGQERWSLTAPSTRRC